MTVIPIWREKTLLYFQDYKRMLRKILIIVLCLSGAILFFMLDPESIFFPKCLFHSITGYSCPGCGLQRAIHDLLHLNISGAFRHNAFLVCSLPLVALLVILERRQSTHTKIYAFLSSKVFIFSLILLVLGWWILRNILHI